MQVSPLKITNHSLENQHHLNNTINTQHSTPNYTSQAIPRSINLHPTTQRALPSVTHPVVQAEDPYSVFHLPRHLISTMAPEKVKISKKPSTTKELLPTNEDRAEVLHSH
ncbi:hypothetical protein MUCCIDRAFT_108437 [Mucor lusitanicus CBS 277.49]|uniref:Uncharacterized protein n=1 Tax=Mucor lusitanicus CBS 277.49 TaxID=747725 RepID=A0A168M9W5_MUCCL|nr:hypothetical protein MUCCIDRAFT_108437 [Mucor lusitanicus CBS 277.49]